MTDSKLLVAATVAIVALLILLFTSGAALQAPNTTLAVILGAAAFGLMLINLYILSKIFLMRIGSEHRRAFNVALASSLLGMGLSFTMLIFGMLTETGAPVIIALAACLTVAALAAYLSIRARVP